MQWIKVIPFLPPDRHTDAHFASLYARARFFIYGNLYLSLHYVREFASLTHSLCLWRINNKPVRWCKPFRVRERKFDQSCSLVKLTRFFFVCELDIVDSSANECGDVVCENATPALSCNVLRDVDRLKPSCQRFVSDVDENWACFWERANWVNTDAEDVPGKDLSDRLLLCCVRTVI